MLRRKDMVHVEWKGWCMGNRNKKMFAKKDTRLISISQG